MATPVSTNFSKSNTNVAFIVEDIDVRGGFRVVTSIADRDAIRVPARKAGMIVRVFNTETQEFDDWTLRPDNLSNSGWVKEVKSSGGTTDPGTGGGETPTEPVEGDYIPTAGGSLTGKLLLSETGVIDFNGKGEFSLDMDNVLYTVPNTTEENKHQIYFNNGNEVTIQLDPVNGQIIAKLEMALSSDETLKTNFVKVDNSLDITNALNGYFFEFKDSLGNRRLGVSAQEVQKVLPEIVGKSVGGKLNVAYASMAALFIENIKELHAIVKQQADEIAELRRMIESRG